MGPSAYPEHLLARHAETADSGQGSGRSPFDRDRDRITYSSAFRSLERKSQVLAASEVGLAHNRLTHSLKVAQLGRSIASRLGDQGAAPDPALMEAACLAHDIGHPPFGHAGETALRLAMDQQRRAAGVPEHEAPDGFEGNAQNLRILTYLASHRDYTKRGLHLTRIALAASIKYPWTRGLGDKTERKWGAYAAEADTLEWVLDGRPEGTDLPVETELMNWCDDVTYAVHDMEDFFRLGFIPLDRLFTFAVPAGHAQAKRDAGPALSDFLDFVQKDWNQSNIDKFGPFDREQAVELLHTLADKISVVEPFEGTHVHKGLLHATVTDLITYFADSVSLENPGVGYDTKIVVPQERQFLCELLKKLIWRYVINGRPSFAAQQRGQMRVMSDLVTWIQEEPDRLLPRDRREELDEHKDTLRAVADHIATLTEPMALTLHRKLSGVNLGAVTDAI